MRRKLLTASAMSKFCKCQRAYHYRYELGVKRVSDSYEMQVGTVWASLLEARANGGDWEKCFQFACEGKNIDPYVFGMVCGMYQAYCEKYGTQDDWVMTPEVKFDLRIDGTYLFHAAGRLDGLGQLNGRPLIVEHKTTGTDLSEQGMFSYWTKLRFDIQLLQYYWAVVESIGVKPEVMYNVVRRPEIKPKLIPDLDNAGLKIVVDKTTRDRQFLANGKPRQTCSDDTMELVSRRETAEEFAKRVYDTIKDKQGSYMVRKQVNILDDDVEKFLKIRLAICQQIVDNERRSKRHGGYAWPMNMSTMNCLKCEYACFCYNGVEPDPNGLPEGFIKKEANEELR